MDNGSINAYDKTPLGLPSFFIFPVILCAIETSPLIGKVIITKRTAFDYKLEDEESAVRTWVTQKVVNGKSIGKTDTLLNNKNLWLKIVLRRKKSTFIKKQKPKELLKFTKQCLSRGTVKEFIRKFHNFLMNIDT